MNLTTSNLTELASMMRRGMEVFSGFDTHSDDEAHEMMAKYIKWGKVFEAEALSVAQPSEKDISAYRLGDCIVYYGKAPHTCPLCQGKGMVLGGNRPDYEGETISYETMCLTCSGSGIVWG